jgi:hypothetical protein
MNNTPVKVQIMELLAALSLEEQKQLLHFGKALQNKMPPGIPGEVLIKHAREINFPKEDLDEMIQAIEEDCGKIDWDGWD